MRWLDGRIAGYEAQIEGRGARPDWPTIDEGIADTESRRMLERYRAGEGWAEIKRSALERPQL